MIDRRLLYVVSTARYGSFTAAADRVGVTQSAITKSVADLEQQLGYSIFDRTARGVILTEEGRLFVERASPLLEETQDLLRGVSAGSNPYAGVLRIGVCPAALEWLATEPLSALVSRHPDLRFSLVGGSYDSTVQQLRGGVIDVAIGYEAAFKEQPDFRCETISTLQTSFFVRNGHPLLGREQVTNVEFARYNLILPSVPFFYTYIWRDIYEDAQVDLQERLHVVDFFPTAARLVRATDAIGVASLNYVQSSAFKKFFSCLPSFDAFPPAAVCCATRVRWTPRPAVRAFVKACRDCLPSPQIPVGSDDAA